MEKEIQERNLVSYSKPKSASASPFSMSKVPRSSTDENDCQIKESEPSWYTCGVCLKNVASDCDVKKFPCLHLVCGFPYDCFQQILISKKNPFGKNALKTVSAFATCPWCKIVYSELDIKEGNEEKRLMLASAKKHCSCKRLSKFQCLQCDTTFCDVCAQFHNSIDHFKTRHFLQNLGEQQIFACSMCEVEKGDFVLENEDRQVLKLFCQSCKERSGKILISWKDYYENVNVTYENYVYTFSEMEENGDILMGRIKNIFPKTIAKSILPGNTAVPSKESDSTCANQMGDLQLHLNDFNNTRILLLRIQHIKAFFQTLLSSYAVGAIKFKNFSSYKILADTFISSVAPKLENLLQTYSQGKSLFMVQNNTTENNSEVVDSNQSANMFSSHQVTGPSETTDAGAINSFDIVTVESEICRELTQNSKHAITSPKVTICFEIIPIKLKEEMKFESLNEDNSCANADKEPADTNIADLNITSISTVYSNETSNIRNLNDTSSLVDSIETSNILDINDLSRIDSNDEVMDSQDTNKNSTAHEVTKDEKEDIKIWISKNLFETDSSQDENEKQNDPNVREISDTEDVIVISSDEDLFETHSDDDVVEISSDEDVEISSDDDVEISSDDDIVEILNNPIDISNDENLRANDLNSTSNIQVLTANNTQNANTMSNIQVLNEASQDQVASEISKTLVANDEKENSLKAEKVTVEENEAGTPRATRASIASTSKNITTRKRKKLDDSSAPTKCECLGRLCKICSLKKPTSDVHHNISPVELEIRHYEMLQFQIERSTYLQRHIDAHLGYDEFNKTVSEGACAICYDGGGPIVICDNQKCEKVFGDKCHIPLFKRIPYHITWNCMFCINKSKFSSPAYQKQAREIYLVPENSFKGDIEKFLTACKFMSDLYSIHESLIVRFKFVYFYKEKHNTEPAFTLNGIRNRLVNPVEDIPPYSSHNELVEDLQILIQQATNLYPKKSKEMAYLAKFQNLYYKKKKEYFS